MMPTSPNPSCMCFFMYYAPPRCCVTAELECGQAKKKKIEGRLTSDEPSMLLLRPTRETITRMYFSSVRQEDHRSPVIEDSIGAHSQWADPRRPCLRVSTLPKSRHLTTISRVRSKCTGSCFQKWVKIQCSRASHPNLGECQP